MVTIEDIYYALKELLEAFEKDGGSEYGPRTARAMQTIKVYKEWLDNDLDIEEMSEDRDDTE